MSKQRFGNELHPLYTRWLSTTQRCCNPNHASYKNYGARGITLSPELTSFEDYRDYVSSLPGYNPDTSTLDRIENDQGYEKGNLRWACRSTQIANQRYSGKGFNKYTGVNWSKSHNRWVARVTFKGKTLLSKVCITEREAVCARNQFIADNGLPHTPQVWSS
jgi:hypothetical protein